MKTYRYVTLGDDDIQPKYYTMTEEQILLGYDKWAARNPNADKETFINEWIRNHCAWEVK